MSDLYTKFLLTVIAMAVSVLAVKAVMDSPAGPCGTRENKCWIRGAVDIDGEVEVKGEVKIDAPLEGLPVQIQRQ